MKTTNPVKLLILWMAMPLLAQVERASVSGIVSDKTGAAVPAAQVSAENLATGVKSATVSNASGNYYLNLLAGDYKLTVTHEGFAASVLPRLTLSVAHLDCFQLVTPAKVQRTESAPIKCLPNSRMSLHQRGPLGFLQRWR